MRRISSYLLESVLLALCSVPCGKQTARLWFSTNSFIISHGCNFPTSKHAPTWEQQLTSPPPNWFFAVYYVPYYNSRNILYSIIVRSRIQAAHFFTMATKHNARQALNLIHPQNNFMINTAGWDCTHSCIYKDFTQHSSYKTEIQRCDCSIWCIRDRFTPLRSYTHQNTVAVGERAGFSFLGLAGYAVLPKPVFTITNIHASKIKAEWIQSCHLIEVSSVF